MKVRAQGLFETELASFSRDNTNELADYSYHIMQLRSQDGSLEGDCQTKKCLVGNSGNQ